MIRVIYTWQVAAANMAAFENAWATATEHIYATVDGALGSCLLHSQDNPDIVLAVARWQSKQHWDNFWQNANPTQMQKMKACGQLQSHTWYEELDDRTR